MKRKILLVSLLSLSLLLTSCHASKQPVSELSESSSETETLPSDETSLSDTTDLSTTQPAETTQSIETMVGSGVCTCAPPNKKEPIAEKPNSTTAPITKPAPTASSGTTTKSLTPISITQRMGKTVNLRGTEITITKAEITHEFQGTIEMIPADTGYCYVMLTFHIKNVNSANRFFLHTRDIHFINSTGNEIPLFYIESSINSNKWRAGAYTFNMNVGEDIICVLCYSMEEKYTSSYKIELKPKTFDPIIDTVTFTK